MPATVNLVDDCILHFVFHDPLTHVEIAAVEEQAKVWYDQAKIKLPIFIDVSDVRTLPEGFLRVRSNYELTHPNAGQIAVVGSTVFVRQLAEVIFRLTRNHRAKFFRRDEAAVAWQYLRSAASQQQSETVVTQSEP